MFAVLAATMVMAVMSGAGAGPVYAQLPVVYNFFAGVPGELTDPGGSLPGSNDWSCRPSPAHPDPVVLVHGTAGGRQTNWGTYVPLLANEGYCVFALTYGAYPLPWPVSAIGGLRPIEDSAAELSAFVDRVLAATGARKVDIVGHSQGTLMPNYYAKRLGGAAKIDKYISLAPTWQGTNGFGVADIHDFAWRLGAGPAIDALSGVSCAACFQFARGSAFLRDLNSDGVYAPGIAYTNIMTRADEGVVPYTSGYVLAPNATNIVVQDGCPQDYSEHLAIAGSPRAAGFVMNALDPAHPRPVPCQFIPPFTG
ncbi:esterase/lipase family protein [Nocardia arthritidis]